jgi:hypothetical protein
LAVAGRLAMLERMRPADRAGALPWRATLDHVGLERAIDDGVVVGGAAATPHARRSLGVRPPTATWYSATPVPAVVALHHCSEGAHQRATCMMVQIHWFREQRPVFRSMIGFVAIAAVLCVFLGPVGILYALGFEVLYLLMIAVAALLGPDVY